MDSEVQEESAASSSGLTHGWDLSVPEAIALQQRLRGLVLHTNAPVLADLHTLAGVDASYGDDGQAAVVLFSFPELIVLDQVVSSRRSVFPYVPGLLSFREIPLVLDAIARLPRLPELLLVDGHGIAHPRRLGIASHLGVYLDIPTIGVAKSRLVGSYDEPGPNPGDRSPLVHRGETIGAVLRTKIRTRPLFISIGHRVDLETAVTLVLRCLRGYRLPEPTRLADALAGVSLKASSSPLFSG